MSHTPSPARLSVFPINYLDFITEGCREKGTCSGGGGGDGWVGGGWTDWQSADKQVISPTYCHSCSPKAFIFGRSKVEVHLESRQNVISRPRRLLATFHANFIRTVHNVLSYFADRQTDTWCQMTPPPFLVEVIYGECIIKVPFNTFAQYLDKTLQKEHL